MPSEQTDDRITLCATADGVAIGTITVGLDGHHGLLAEDVFPEEIDGLRKAGKRICEFTKLATEPAADAKRLLASLFHVAYIIAHRIRGCDTLVIEVNPRHVAYYRRLLGGRVLGDVRTNGRVNAPAVLLCFDLEQTRHQIDLNELKGQSRSNRDSLYSHGFSSCEEAGIMTLMSKPTGSTPESRM